MLELAVMDLSNARGRGRAIRERVQRFSSPLLQQCRYSWRLEKTSLSIMSG